MTTATAPPTDVVRAGFEAFGRGDLAAFAEQFEPDATWNHRNPDRLGGIHAGIDAIIAFLAGVRAARPPARCAPSRPR